MPDFGKAPPLFWRLVITLVRQKYRVPPKKKLLIKGNMFPKLAVPVEVLVCVLYGAALKFDFLSMITLCQIAIQVRKQTMQTVFLTFRRPCTKVFELVKTDLDIQQFSVYISSFVGVSIFFYGFWWLSC